MTPQESLLTKPKKVALVGLGMSRYDYASQIIGGYCEQFWDEVWTMNMGLGIFVHDKLFVMDDLRIQAGKFPHYGRKLSTHDRPIITSQSYPEFPMSINLPIQEICTKIGDDYFVNTACYTIAYAIYIGVEELTLYGCDFHYPNSDLREEGGQNAAYLLGLARTFGMTFKMTQTTTFMGANSTTLVDGHPRRKLYGYKTQPFIPMEVTDGPRPGKDPALRKSEGNHPDAVSANQPSDETEGGWGTPLIRPEGEGVLGGRGGDPGSSGMVLGTGKDGKSGGSTGVRLDPTGGNGTPIDYGASTTGGETRTDTAHEIGIVGYGAFESDK